ncbi:MAG: methylase N-4/N-6 domain protein [Candidatus Woesebacteria bacterium GW2011_GWA1_39_11b]|nr:MAG: methylase N-4/N-6 domain protein [Candidatus Woesebacteria bacterium GW2011_GWA1_39_11b]KKS77101.1 MAG: methylase N-4/N-6 domain protein [Candidatus Woesebacteria bacterium GW2011_GWC1_42_9]
METLYNCHYNELFQLYGNGHFDLAIVDPPYGIDVNSMPLGSGKYKSDKKWDCSPPDEAYFKELFRVAKHVVLWGANHYIDRIPNPDSPCWLIWDKRNGTSDFADAELAWTNFDCPVRKFSYSLSQCSKAEIKNRFHPTQKPIQLYKWILTNFAKPGWKILDTHLGSATIARACHSLGFDITGCEIEKEYYTQAMEGLKEYKKNNLTIFGVENKQEEQQQLF